MILNLVYFIVSSVSYGGERRRFGLSSLQKVRPQEVGHGITELENSLLVSLLDSRKLVMDRQFCVEVKGSKASFPGRASGLPRLQDSSTCQLFLTTTTIAQS
jgi:hypothetical protein